MCVSIMSSMIICSYRVTEYPTNVSITASFSFHPCSPIPPLPSISRSANYPTVLPIPSSSVHTGTYPNLSCAFLVRKYRVMQLYRTRLGVMLGGPSPNIQHVHSISVLRMRARGRGMAVIEFAAAGVGSVDGVFGVEEVDNAW